MARLLIEALDLLEAGEPVAAREVAEEFDGEGAAWLRAHLHRAAGDEDAARRWYGEANMAPFAGDLTEERYALRQELTSGTAGTPAGPPSGD